MSLIELVVVTAIGSVLLGVVLGGVQRSRAAAARAACGNNVRQLAVALHHYHAATGRFPTGVGGVRSPTPFLTWCGRLLPYLEQEAAWRDAVEDFDRQRAFYGSNPHRNLARPVSVLLCPADGRQVGTTDDMTTAAFTFYLGVAGVSGRRGTGVLYQESAVRSADVTDGLSQTIIVGERPPSADLHYGWWYAGIGQSDYDGAADSVLAAREYRRTFRAPTCPRGPHPFQPGDPDDMCSMFHFWSRHPGGAHFAFADGSVRFLRYDADAVLPALATRAGGEAVAVPD